MELKTFIDPVNPSFSGTGTFGSIVTTGGGTIGTMLTIGTNLQVGGWANIDLAFTVRGASASVRGNAVVDKNSKCNNLTCDTTAQITGDVALKGNVSVSGNVTSSMTFTGVVGIENNAIVDQTLNGKWGVFSSSLICGDFYPSTNKIYPIGGNLTIYNSIDLNKSNGELTFIDATAGKDDFRFSNYGSNGLSIQQKVGDTTWTRVISIEEDSHSIILSPSGEVSNSTWTASALDLNANLSVARGYIQLYSRTIAELKLITPTAVGQVYYCSDSTPASLYISSGTGQYAFVKHAGGATD